MKKLYFLLITLLITTISFGQTSDLYFSMYGEGGGSNKFLEIYNGTGADIDLSGYSVELYSNGATTATNTEIFTAGTMLVSGDVYVIYNSGAVAEIINNGDVSSTVTFYNGDDAVALLKGTTVIDVIGEIGVDPGSFWDVGSTTGGTQNHTLVRKFDVCGPNATALGSFGTDDASSEWTVYAIDAEFGQIGSHVACSASPILTITAPTEGTELAPGTTSVNVEITVQNFTVASGTGDGHIHWTINSVAQPMKYDTNTEAVTVVDGGSYTVYMELRDNSHATLVPAVNQTVNFSVLNPCANNIGDIIVTEIMQNPNAVADGSGEYFEVYNTTASPIDINGWEISDLGSNSHIIASSLVVPANGYAVLGINSDFATNGGVTVDYEYGSAFALGNSDDEVILTCSGTIIDQVNYDGGATFPDPTGASMELANDKLNATDNDDGANWSTATVAYGDGDLGTPGAAAPSTPTLTIAGDDSPPNGSSGTFGPQDTNPTIEFATTNFTVGVPNAGDGYIKWETRDSGDNILESGQVQDITTTITPSFIAGNTYVFNAWLVDNAGDPLVPPVIYSITATFEAYNQVANLAELRAGTVDGYYHVTGEIIGTFGQSFRNQKWAEDATAGILIDDNNGIITTAYVEGDGITGLKGQLGEFAGVMQLVPTEDPGTPSSTGNTVIPQTVSMADLTANGEMYESELVKINEKSFFTLGDGAATFFNGTVYAITGATDSFNVRTTFFDVDYITTVIPYNVTDLTGIITVRNTTEYYLTPRNLTVDLLLDVKKTEIDGFGLYPNPVSNGFITITTPNNLEKNVNIFDVLGKQVYAKTIQNGEKVNVSKLNSGVYIIRIEEDAKIATRKLIIR